MRFERTLAWVAAALSAVGCADTSIEPRDAGADTAIDAAEDAADADAGGESEGGAPCSCLTTEACTASSNACTLSACAGEIAACLADPECVALSDCLQGCYGQRGINCYKGCITEHASGKPKLDAVAACRQANCSTSCVTCCIDGTKCAFGRVCAQSVCMEPVAGACWNDEECGPGLTCAGVVACPCGETCLVADQPGSCQ